MLAGCHQPWCSLGALLLELASHTSNPASYAAKACSNNRISTQCWLEGHLKDQGNQLPKFSTRVPYNNTYTATCTHWHVHTPLTG